MASKIGFLRHIHRRLPKLVIRSLYLSCICPTLEYAGEAWGGLGAVNSDQIERCQRAAARLITGVTVRDNLPRELLLARAGLDSSQCRDVKLATALYRPTKPPGKGPPHLRETLQKWFDSVPGSTSSMCLQSSDSQTVQLPKPLTELLRNSPFYCGFAILNSVPSDAKLSLSSLKSHLSALS